MGMSPKAKIARDRERAAKSDLRPSGKGRKNTVWLLHAYEGAEEPMHDTRAYPTGASAKADARARSPAGFHPAVVAVRYVRDDGELRSDSAEVAALVRVSRSIIKSHLAVCVCGLCADFAAALKPFDKVK